MKLKDRLFTSLRITVEYKPNRFFVNLRNPLSWILLLLIWIGVGIFQFFHDGFYSILDTFNESVERRKEMLPLKTYDLLITYNGAWRIDCIQITSRWPITDADIEYGVLKLKGRTYKNVYTVICTEREEQP